MAITLDSTVAGVDANSYASLADAQAYIDTLVPTTLGDSWNDSGEEEQTAALVMATRLLDTWFDWIGFVHSGDQRLLWPRSGVTGLNGYSQPEDEIPERIIEATAEWARQLLAGDKLSDSDIETNKLKSLKAGPVELEFGGGVTAKSVPDSVMAMVAYFGTLRSKYGTGTVTLLRS